MAETSETAEEFAKHWSVWTTHERFAAAVQERDFAIAAAARREERAHLVRILNEALAVLPNPPGDGFDDSLKRMFASGLLTAISIIENDESEAT